LKKIDSNNVIKLFGCEETVHRYYLFTQYCNAGDLQSLLKCRSRLFESDARHILKEIVNGFRSLSANGIIHRDLKPENIMLKLKNFTFQEFL
jgi:serine/threonine protein kinase